MIIAPEVIVTPDHPTIRFREPREKVDLDIELPRILHAQGWGCGNYFNVQFLSHDKTRLLSSALYVVYQVSETIHTSETNPYQPITKMVFSRKASLIGEWWIAPAEVNPDEILTVTWNPGKKLHQVKRGNELIYETPDKDIANQIATGKASIP